MRLAKRVSDIKPSATLTLDSRVKDMKSQGIDVLDFISGEPEFDTHETVTQAAKDALDRGETRYSAPGGKSELITRIAAYRDCGTENVIVTNGAKEGLYLSFMTLLNPGDEVILPLPYWVSFTEQIKLAGGVPRLVESLDDNQLSIEAIKNAINENTRVILINSPNNPTGALYKREDLLAVADLAKTHDLWLISDEAYAGFIFDNEEFTSIREFAHDNTIVIRSLSKTFAMTGWRIGYVVAPREIVGGMVKFKGQLNGNVHTYGQFGAMKVFELDREILSERLFEVDRKRKYITNELEGLYDFVMPQGAFYFWSKVPKNYGTDLEFASYLLEEKLMGIVPGTAFGKSGFFRMSYAVPYDRLEKGVAVLKELVKA